jgi:hypothetical protein
MLDTCHKNIMKQRSNMLVHCDKVRREDVLWIKVYFGVYRGCLCPC